MADADDLRRIRSFGARNLINNPPQWDPLGLDDLQQHPYKSIGALFTKDGDLTGTAWLIGDRVALTAAHAAISELVLNLPGETVSIDAIVRHEDYENRGANADFQAIPMTGDAAAIKKGCREALDKLIAQAG